MQGPAIHHPSKKSYVMFPVAAKALAISKVTSSNPNRPHSEIINDLETVHLEEERPDRMVRVGGEMTESTRHVVVKLLRDYEDIFTFSPYEMLGIDPVVIEHYLNIDLAYKFVAQKKRHMGTKRSATITAEVQKPLDADLSGSVSTPSGFQTWCY